MSTCSRHWFDGRMPWPCNREAGPDGICNIHRGADKRVNAQYVPAAGWANDGTELHVAETKAILRVDIVFEPEAPIKTRSGSAMTQFTASLIEGGKAEITGGKAYRVRKDGSFYDDPESNFWPSWSLIPDWMHDEVLEALAAAMTELKERA